MADATRTLGIVLFPGFELLDVCGPAEMFGKLPEDLRVVMVAEQAGPVRSAQSVSVHADYAFEDSPHLDLLMVPGGEGTRPLVGDERLLHWLAGRSAEAELVTSVCTGAALLARAGVLEGRRATSNKRALGWVMEQGPDVEWVLEARWVEDGNVVTSSGVAAGIDMALAVIARFLGEQRAQELADRTEYDWHRDASWDPFARLNGLAGASEGGTVSSI